MKMIKSLICVAIIAFGSSIAIDAQVPQLNKGVGILMRESVNQAQLPEAAKEFIKTHFGDKKIAKSEHEILAGTYEVEFKDGTDLEFDDSGLCTEVSAGKGQVLSEKVLKSVLPSEAYKTIVAQNLDKKVDEIVVSAYNGYKVEFKNASIDDMQFDTAGILTNVDYD